MENIDLHKPQIELEGILHALHHLDYLNMTPKMVDQWCNNMQAVKDTMTQYKLQVGCWKRRQILYSPYIIWKTDTPPKQEYDMYMGIKTQWK